MSLGRTNEVVLEEILKLPYCRDRVHRALRWAWRKQPPNARAWAIVQERATHYLARLASRAWDRWSMQQESPAGELLAIMGATCFDWDMIASGLVGEHGEPFRLQQVTGKRHSRDTAGELAGRDLSQGPPI